MQDHKDNLSIDLSDISDLFKANVDDISIIPVKNIGSFPEHPFSVNDDEDMEKLILSIKENGILTPLRIRPIGNGNYQLISGHRRMFAARALGIEEVPAIVKDMPYDQAIIEMVDSNLQREAILPSEKAFAYKMKLEAIKKMRSRGQAMNGRSRSDEILATSSPDSARTIQRYIRLTNLIPEMLELVDERKVTVENASSISYLSDNQQQCIAEYIKVYGKISAAGIEAVGILDIDATSTEVFNAINSAQAAPTSPKFSLKTAQIKEYFPKGYTSQDIEKVILGLLQRWRKEQYPCDQKMDDES